VITITVFFAFHSQSYKLFRILLNKLFLSNNQSAFW